MKNILFFPINIFLEFCTNIKNYLKYFAKLTPPIAWKQGDKSILLIQGLNEKYTYMSKIANVLNKQGYQIHFLPLNTHLLIKDISLHVAKYIQTNNLKNFSIISHSKGGLVAKYLVDNYPKISNQVQKIITIATPWSGVIFGILPFWGLPEIRYKSESLKRLCEPNTKNIFNLYPIYDNRVIPQSSLILPCAKNIKINTIGHNRILDSNETIRTILSILSFNPNFSISNSSK